MKKKFILIAFYFFSIFLVYGSVEKVDMNSTTIYYSGYITLSVGRDFKTEFYEVIESEEGKIYLNIEDLLFYLELDKYTVIEETEETIEILVDENLYRELSGESGGKKGRKTIGLKKELNMLIVEGKYYIEKEDLMKILDVKDVKWRINEYTLELSPSFNIPLDYRKAKDRRKGNIDYINNKQEREQDFFLKNQRSMATLGMLEFKYDIFDIKTIYDGEGNDNDYGTVNLRYSSQLLYGDFYTYINTYPTFDINTVRIEYPYLIEGKMVTLGDKNIESDDILGYNSQIRGISIGRNSYFNKREGRNLEINGSAESEATIELYQNDRLVDTVDSSSGEYSFELELSSRLDKVEIKVYDRDGMLIEKEVLGAINSNKFRDKNHWDYNVFFGKNPDESGDEIDDFKGDISYGITDRLTYGLDYFHLNSESKKYDYYKHSFKYRTLNLIVPILLSIDYYNEKNGNGSGTITDMELRMFNHDIYYTHRNYNNNLMEDKGVETENEMEISGTYKKIRYFVGYSDEKDGVNSKKEYIGGSRFRIGKNISTQIDLTKKIDEEKKSETTVELGVDYKLNKLYTLSLDIEKIEDEGVDGNIKLRKRLGKDGKSSYDIKVSYKKDNTYALELGFDYRFDNFLRGDIDYNSDRADRIIMGATYDKVIDLNHPLKKNTAKDPKRGAIMGDIFLDRNGNGIRDKDEKSVEGVRIEMDSDSVNSDKNGKFYLSNISPYKDHSLHYDYTGTTVDPTLRAPKDSKFKIVPSTVNEYLIPLAPMSMVMGDVEIKGSLANRMRRKIYSLLRVNFKKDGKLYETVNCEYDGFYIAQDLVPGRYEIEIEYLGSEKLDIKGNNQSLKVEGKDVGGIYEIEGIYIYLLKEE